MLVVFLAVTTHESTHIDMMHISLQTHEGQEYFVS